jgi:hypothetical protein
MLQVQPPFAQFFTTSGTPLNNGSIYIGATNLNPETNPVSVYWDDALTIPAVQPIKTSNGYPVRNGTPARLYIANADFSMTVRDSKRQLVWTVLSATSLADADKISFLQAGVGAVQRSVQSKSRESVSVMDFMTAAQIADVQAGTQLLDCSDAFAKALVAYKGVFAVVNVYAPGGVYRIDTKLSPKTTQMIFGDGVNETILKAGTVGMTVIDYPSGAYSNVCIRDLSIDGNNKAATGLKMIASGQGAISNCEFSNVQIAQCTTYQFYLSQATYCVIDRCAFSGGTGNAYGLFLNACYSSEVKNCIIHDGSNAAMLAVNGSQMLFTKNTFYNEAANPSPALVILDGTQAFNFVDCEFEPQGAGNVTYEVILKATASATQSCTDNSFTRCRFIGLSNTKTNCVGVGTVGAVYKTRFTECAFIKPSATNSISLQTHAETSFVRCCDLVTYGTETFYPVTITNSGNPYFIENLPGNFGPLSTSRTFYANGGVVQFPAIQMPSSSPNGLDDYEEGTFTPTFFGSVGNPTVTYTIQSGRYTKIGRLVFIQIHLQLSAASGGAGALYVTGLPFSSLAGADGSMAIGGKSGWSAQEPSFANEIAGSDYITMSYGNGITNAALVPANLTATTRLVMSACYQTL